MADNYKTYNDYLRRQREIELANAQTIDYNPASPSALKSALAKVMRSDYDKAIANRQKTAAKNRAAIDSDAAARGMGSSTWVTDVKNRQNDAAATDIAGLEGDYLSALYSNLLGKMSEQEANRLSVDQYNASQRQNALAQALATTNQWWQNWKPQTNGGPSGPTGGGNPNQGAGEPDPAAAKLQALINRYNAAGMANNAPSTNKKDILAFNAQQKLADNIRRAKNRIQNAPGYMQ